MFFDQLGIAWEHEPEGFETSNGNYLPDFRVRYSPKGEWTWFEVKPPDSTPDRRHTSFAWDMGVHLAVARGMARDYHDQYSATRLTRIYPEPGWAERFGFVPLVGGGASLHADPLCERGRTYTAIDRAYAAARSERFGA